MQRWGYRVAYAGLRVYWRVFHPRVSGVKCILTHGDEVLLVRHTYGPKSWDLPGGTVRRGEAPEATARREMGEELGLNIDGWRLLGRLEMVIDHKRDTLHCFQAELAAPDVVIDRGELSVAEWFPGTQLPREIGRYARLILERLLEPA